MLLHCGDAAALRGALRRGQSLVREPANRCGSLESTSPPCGEMLKCIATLFLRTSCSVRAKGRQPTLFRSVLRVGPKVPICSSLISPSLCFVQPRFLLLAPPPPPPPRPRPLSPNLSPPQWRTRARPSAGRAASPGPLRQVRPGAGFDRVLLGTFRMTVECFSPSVPPSVRPSPAAAWQSEWTPPRSQGPPALPLLSSVFVAPSAGEQKTQSTEVVADAVTKVSKRNQRSKSVGTAFNDHDKHHGGAPETESVLFSLMNEINGKTLSWF